MPLWLLTGLGAVRKAAAGLFALIARYPWQATCIMLLCVSAWLWHGKSVALSDLGKCKAARTADAWAYHDAQDKAAKAALAAKAATEQHYKDIANEADLKAAKAAVDANARAAEYIRTHRVSARPASPSGRAVAAPESGGSANPDRPGSGAELVEVTADDIQVCTTNTVRLQQAREWALGLTTPPAH